MDTMAVYIWILYRDMSGYPFGCLIRDLNGYNWIILDPYGQ